jgi:hypothetical protein
MADDDDVVADDDAPQKVILKVVTLDVATVSPDEFEEIVKELAPPDSAPTVVAVQNVSSGQTSKALRAFKSQGFTASVAHTREATEYVFTNAKVLEKRYVPFGKTDQNRGVSLFLLNLTVGGPKIWVATSQLETGSRGKVARISQYANLATLLPSEVIFAGDVAVQPFENVSLPNDFRALKDEAREKSSTFRDAWREKGTSENESLVSVPGGERAERSSRILSRGVEIESYGTGCLFLRKHAAVATFLL